MARLRDGYEQFTRRGVEIIAIGPNPASIFEQYWHNERIPFLGVPDPDHLVAAQYRQEVNLLRLGRMPLSCIIDANGSIRFAQYGTSMRDIPSNQELLDVIDELNDSSN